MSENVPIDNKLILLRTILDCLGVKTIRIHQIDFLMMYFPFYMMIDDFKKSKTESGKDIIVEFVNFSVDDKGLKLPYGNDDGIFSNILNNNIDRMESLSDDGETLNLYLCEPVPFNPRNNFEKYEEKVPIGGFGHGIDKLTLIENLKLERERETKNHKLICLKHTFTNTPLYFIHEPFINFPPLYGISLVNNPQLNKIKNDLIKEENEEPGKPTYLSRSNYWKHFSAKFSLLQKHHFKKLVASIYPKGSTTDWFIRKKDNYKFELKGKTWVELPEEFEDIFHGHADVAFTVQPWVAVSKTKSHETPFEIEIVYKNRSEDYDCTSIIFVSKTIEKLVIGNYVIKMIYALLQEKIVELYGFEKKGIDKRLENFCDLKRNSICAHAKCANGTHYNATGCKNKTGCTTYCDCECCGCGLDGREKKEKGKHGCIFENRIALEILADSQIYKPKPADYEFNTPNIENVTVDYFLKKIKYAPDEMKYELLSKILAGA
jgi:hypothetical protein